MIYLAAPYSHPDWYVVCERMTKFYEKQVELINSGHLVVSPLDKVYMSTAYNTNTTWEFWQRYSQELLTRCEIVYILMIDGWKESQGVQAEIELATKLNKPIVYIEV